MKNYKTLFVGAGVAGANFLASAGTLIRPDRCAGSCGSCSYACVPAAAALVGVGGIVIAYRKLKARFLLNRK